MGLFQYEMDKKDIVRVCGRKVTRRGKEHPTLMRRNVTIHHVLKNVTRNIGPRLVVYL